jgi:hypothetical protein
VVRQLKDAGTWVTVLQRKNDDRPEIEKMGAFLCKGDALIPKDVKKAFDMVGGGWQVNAYKHWPYSQEVSGSHEALLVSILKMCAQLGNHDSHRTFYQNPSRFPPPYKCIVNS